MKDPFNPPWTLEELRNEMLPLIEKNVREQQEAQPNARPLPLMNSEEAMDSFNRLMDIAHERALTEDECFLHGQLLSVYRSAVIGEHLGIKERVFIITESQMQAAMGKKVV